MTTEASHGLPGVEIRAPECAATEAVLTAEALAFLAALTREFRPRVSEILAQRVKDQADYDAGKLPDFDPSTESIRSGDWRAAPLPADLLDRRVEITGPVDRKMVINALNSGASTYMADFEDSTTPTWSNLIEGQANLAAAIRRQIDFRHPDTGKQYALNDTVATLLVRPRGWHLVEKHILVDGESMPGGLMDFGLYVFLNARELVAQGSGPYFYLPKLQHSREAKLWDDVFRFAQAELGLPVGTMKATVLCETLPAAFQMNEILYALREHAAGLNCGRWDYIFSAIKTVLAHPDRIMPDRGDIGMTQPFMRAYTQQLIRVCHRRGVHAMGGMAAQIPLRNDPEANAAALEKVRADKLREASDGHDGTWVAHPALVSIAKEVFDAQMPGPNQLDVAREDAVFTADQLLEVPTGARTMEGLKHSVAVGVQYLEYWIQGQGCVALYGLMEDAATAEICRAQIHQWVRHGVHLDDGTLVDAALLDALLSELPQTDAAKELFREVCLTQPFIPFLTLTAYDRLD